jgi:SAM-dependent methyltransferase
MAVQLIDPASGEALVREGEKLRSPSRSYPIIEGVPRVCEEENYADSFGFQWNRFAKTQIDREGNRSEHSAERFFAETGWTAEDLDGVDLLEVGSGAGRFSRVILEQTRANLYSVDYSSAVEANRRNNGSIAPDRFHLFQASIYDMPFPDDSFDKVLCLGVLQHTPDFEASIRALVAKAKPGGEIVVDFYPIRGWWTKINAKYLLRPMTKRMDQNKLLNLIDRNADRLIGAYRLLSRARLRPATRFLPVCDIEGTLPRGLSREELRDWVVLDTFDMFSPAFDNPQRIRKVVGMFERAGAEIAFAGHVATHGRPAVVRAIKSRR